MDQQGHQMAPKYMAHFWQAQDSGQFCQVLLEQTWTRVVEMWRSQSELCSLRLHGYFAHLYGASDRTAYRSSKRPLKLVEESIWLFRSNQPIAIQRIRDYLFDFLLCRDWPLFFEFDGLCVFGLWYKQYTPDTQTMQNFVEETFLILFLGRWLSFNWTRSYLDSLTPSAFKWQPTSLLPVVDQFNQTGSCTSSFSWVDCCRLGNAWHDYHGSKRNKSKSQQNQQSAQHPKPAGQPTQKRNVGNHNENGSTQQCQTANSKL